MCFSAEMSLFSFVVGFVGSVLVALYPSPLYRFSGLFLGFVSIMQLIEYLLWKHQICDTYHKALSVTGMVLNHLQPVVFGLLAWLIFQKNGASITAILAVYLCVIIPYSLQYLGDQNLQCTLTRCDNPHLVWNWNNIKYADFAYTIFMLTLVSISIVGITPLTDGMLVACVSLLTFGVSFIIYGRQVLGALWCFWTAFIPVVLLAYKYVYN